MNIIDKLKNNERAWKFLSPEEQACMKKANAKSMVEYLQCDGTWEGTPRPWSSLGMEETEMLRIKPDYQPETEYADWAIENINNLLCVAERPEGKVTCFKPLYSAVCLPTFVKLFSGHDQNVTIALDRVAREMRHAPVYARFRKE